MSNEESKKQAIKSIVELLHQANIDQLEEIVIFIKNYIL